MGEMIKFGIKVALTVATTLALCAALLILFDLISSAIPQSSGNGFNYVSEMFKIIGLFIPFRFSTFIVMVSSLFSFKVAYWAADKMLWIIDVLG